MQIMRLLETPRFLQGKSHQKKNNTLHSLLLRCSMVPGIGDRIPSAMPRMFFLSTCDHAMQWSHATTCHGGFAWFMCHMQPLLTRTATTCHSPHLSTARLRQLLHHCGTAQGCDGTDVMPNFVFYLLDLRPFSIFFLNPVHVKHHLL